MDKYIKREDAIAEFQELKNKCESLKDAIYFDGVMAVLDNIPAEDVAPVVRCRECKYKNWLREPCVSFKDDDFCAYGKKEAEHDKHPSDPV